MWPQYDCTYSYYNRRECATPVQLVVQITEAWLHAVAWSPYLGGSLSPCTLPVAYYTCLLYITHESSPTQGSKASTDHKGIANHSKHSHRSCTGRFCIMAIVVKFFSINSLSCDIYIHIHIQDGKSTSHPTPVPLPEDCQVGENWLT